MISPDCLLGTKVPSGNRSPRSKQVEKGRLSRMLFTSQRLTLGPKPKLKAEHPNIRFHPLRTSSSQSYDFRLAPAADVHGLG